MIANQSRYPGMISKYLDMILNFKLIILGSWSETLSQQGFYDYA